MPMMIVANAFRPASLVLDMPLSDNILDICGNFTATLGGASTITTYLGKKALRLSGYGDQIAIAANDITKSFIMNGTSFTFEFYILYTAVTTFKHDHVVSLWNKTDGNYISLANRQFAGNRMVVYYNPYGIDSAPITESANSSANNVWYHYCLQFTNSKFLQLYQNGILVGQRNTSLPAIQGNGTMITFGPAGNHDDVYGYIRNVKLYKGQKYASNFTPEPLV